MIILGLDMSSTAIGACCLTPAGPPYLEHYDLPGKDIGARCLRARRLVASMLETYSPALVVIESPVGRFASSVIPQARVSGAVLSLLTEHEALWTELAPKNVKRVLAGDGAATKREMVEAAARAMGLDGEAREHRGKWGLWREQSRLLSEDEADAYGLALAGRAVRVEVCA